MKEEYKLEKWIWTEADFEQLGWHDCPVYAIRFDEYIYLDIDYIFKWNSPAYAGLPYTFWIAPATLVFEHPSYLKIGIETDFINGFEISEILKEKNEKGETIWNIETQEGRISVGAAKLKQIIRRPPSFQYGQAIPFDERGGISFSIIPEEDYLFSSEILKRREQESQQYALVEKRLFLNYEREHLNREQLGTKQFLIKKRDLEKKISDIDNALKDCRFESMIRI